MRFPFFLAIALFTACKNSTHQLPHNRIFEDTNIETDKVQLFNLVSEPPKSYNIPESFIYCNVDSIIKDLEIVELESTPKSQIQQIDKIFLLNDRIIVVDKTISGTIFIFDQKGHFVNSIHNLGKGSNEYRVMSNVAIDYDNSNLIVHDSKTARILVYNLEGKLIKSEKIGLRYRDFIILGSNKTLLFTSNAGNDHLPDIDNYTLLILEDNKNVSFKGFYVNPILSDLTVFNPQHIFQYENKYYVFPRFSDTIFQVTSSGKLIPSVKFVTKNLLPEEFLLNDMNRKLFNKRITDQRYNYYMGDFLSNDSHIITILNSGGNIAHTIIINKHNSHVIAVNSFKFNTGSISLPGFARPIAVLKGMFVSVVSPQYFLRLKRMSPDTLQLNFSNVKAKNLFEKVNDNSNPVLLFYKLNDF